MKTSKNNDPSKSQKATAIAMFIVMIIMTSIMVSQFILFVMKMEPAKYFLLFAVLPNVILSGVQCLLYKLYVWLGEQNDIKL